MLTSSTVRILNKLSSESDLLYSQGGLLYKYKYGHRCAHSDLNRFDGTLSENVIEPLELFLSSALGTMYPEVVAPSIKKKCKMLLESLGNDFKGFQGPKVYQHTDDTSKIIVLVYTLENDYHYLDLFWSID